MDWKDGLTAAAIVGVGLFGVKTIRDTQYRNYLVNKFGDRNAESFSADEDGEPMYFKTFCPYCNYGKKIEDHTKHGLVNCFKRYLTEHPDAEESKPLRRDVIYEAWSNLRHPLFHHQWKDGVFPHQMDNLTRPEVNWLYEKRDAYPPFDIEAWYKNTPETFNAESFAAEKEKRSKYMEFIYDMFYTPGSDAYKIREERVLPRNDSTYRLASQVGIAFDKRQRPFDSVLHNNLKGLSMTSQPYYYHIPYKGELFVFSYIVKGRGRYKRGYHTYYPPDSQFGEEQICGIETKHGDDCYCYQKNYKAESFSADSISICGVCSVAGHRHCGHTTGCPCCEIRVKKYQNRPICRDCLEPKTHTPQEYEQWTCWPCRDAAGGHGNNCYCYQCMAETDESYSAEEKGRCKCGAMTYDEVAGGGAYQCMRCNEKRFVFGKKPHKKVDKGAESHAYSYAYNEGHSDSRKTGEYRPSLSTGSQEASFKRILKQKGD